MNRIDKKELNQFFAAPMPERKQAFMRQIARTKRGRGRSFCSMLSLQCRYISPKVWLFSIAFFGFVLVSNYFAASASWIPVFAMVPFLVMLTVTESMRSYRNGMEELEMTTRYSLKTVIYMRLLVLGGGNLLLLLVSVFFVREHFFSCLLYMLTPYFLTAAGNLWIVRTFAGRESNYICLGFAALVVCAEYQILVRWNYFFEERYLGAWLLALVIFILLCAREGQTILKQSLALA